MSNSSAYPLCSVHPSSRVGHSVLMNAASDTIALSDTPTETKWRGMVDSTLDFADSGVRHFDQNSNTCLSLCKPSSKSRNTSILGNIYVMLGINVARSFPVAFCTSFHIP